MDYVFWYINGGWYLKIDTIEKLLDYVKNTNKQWENVFLSLVNSKEFNKYGVEHADKIACSVGFYGINHKLSALQATNDFRYNVFRDQLNELCNDNIILINRNNGYYSIKKDSEKPLQFYVSKEFKFPKFSKDDIRIKKFPLGNHYYAYIGNVQLRNKDKVKWNSYEEALDFASKYIK